MKVPLAYSFRNLWTRKLTTALTAGGMALVVFVYATVLMMDEGLKKTLVDTGQSDNVVVIRKGSETEVQSGVYQDQAALIESFPEIATDMRGNKLLSKELVVLIGLPKRDNGKRSNVVIRGTSEVGVQLRPQVKIIEGRWFQPGSTEVVVGRSIADRFEGAQLGDTLSFAQRQWQVVGVFDAGKSGFDSEIWGDALQMKQSFRRITFSSAVAKLTSPASFDALLARIASEPRLTVDTKRETQFYADQSKALSTFISILGMVLSVIFSIGAMIGAMITMYAAVANRVAEIGTLRALGFKRRAILIAFLAEAIFLALVGGVLGLVVASFMQFFTISTMNWQSFSELAFTFTLNPTIVAKTLVFALIMGVVGGFLPAVRAARLKIVDALRAA